MNHGPAFQALWKRLRAQVRQLQDRGYYGDGISSLDAFLHSPYLIRSFFKGYWSSGTRLSDSARITGDGIQEGDLPEYMALFILCTYLVVY